MTVHPTPALAALAAKAKSPQQGLFPGNEDPVGFWLTPETMMDWLQEVYGPFTTDACPFPRPAGFDGTKDPWGPLTHCNPPFEGAGRPGLMAWTRKAIEEKHKGNASVLTFPMDEWVHAAVEHGAVFKSAGKHKWIDAKTGKERPAGRKTMLIHFPAGVVVCPAIPGVKDRGCKLCLPAIEACPNCGGDGMDPDNDRKTPCPACRESAIEAAPKCPICGANMNVPERGFPPWCPACIIERPAKQAGRDQRAD